MKLFNTIVLVALCACHFSAQAGVRVGATRVIYQGGKKEAALNVFNPDDRPFLIQSLIVDNQDDTNNVPFIITPPLFRLDSKQENVLRIVNTRGGLPQNKESLYWITVKSIPAAEKNSNRNVLLIAIKTRIKLIYRPAALTDKPEDITEQLVWKNNGGMITVFNPTAYYMNFASIRINGVEIKDPSYLPPGSSKNYSVSAGTVSSLSWKLINDSGGSTKEFRAKL
nr:molecular chaperone [uncultured Enterobacter sp.]